jgi:NAD(P)-dependent dehydrogenase (short-subunit alcohol dehydrogenase family)
MRRLEGKVAVITGGNQGLGKGIAKLFAAEGARLALCARNAAKLTATADELRARGVDVLDRPVDVGQEAAVEKFFQDVMERFGRVDILVNNAGLGTAYPATRETPEQFRQVIDVNLNGSYWMAQACGRLMQPGSSIVNIASVLAITTAGMPQAAYSSSKAALMGLTRDLAQQWTGRKGIRVNAIAPGYFATEMTEQYPPGYLDSMHSRMLVPRMGKLEECAATLIWLVSPAAGYVTGQTIVVDGGVSIT